MLTKKNAPFIRITIKSTNTLIIFLFQGQAIMQRCVLLADLDYTHTTISNNSGDLSAHYPSHLIILEYEKHRMQNLCDTPPPMQRTTETIYESIYDSSKLKVIFEQIVNNTKFLVV